MKQLLFFLLISAAVQGQSDWSAPARGSWGWQYAGDTISPYQRLADEQEDYKLKKRLDTVWLHYTPGVHKLHFDTIPGAMQVIFWRKPFGCRECEDFQTYRVTGYEVKSWYVTSQFYAGGRIYDKTYYLTADKEPVPERVTVVLFVKKPEK